MTMAKQTLRLLSLCAPLLASCVDALVRDPSFDMWCGKKLCHWKVEQGHVDRVPTWHRADYGTSFRERETRFSQASSNTDAECLHFEVIADTARSAKLTLTLDFDDDGEADWEQTLPESDWETYELWVEAPLDREGIIFGVEKRGSGRAVLAQLNVTEDHSCEGRQSDL